MFAAIADVLEQVAHRLGERSVRPRSRCGGFDQPMADQRGFFRMGAECVLKLGPSASIRSWCGEGASLLATSGRLSDIVRIHIRMSGGRRTGRQHDTIWNCRPASWATTVSMASSPCARRAVPRSSAAGFPIQPAQIVETCHGNIARHAPPHLRKPRWLPWPCCRSRPPPVEGDARGKKIVHRAAALLGHEIAASHQRWIEAMPCLARTPCRPRSALPPRGSGAFQRETPACAPRVRAPGARPRHPCRRGCRAPDWNARHASRGCTSWPAGSPRASGRRDRVQEGASSSTRR